MEYNKLKDLAVEAADLYDILNKKNGHNTWTYREYLEGLTGDLGDLHKLLTAKRGYRYIDGDLDEKVAHELVDCLWSLILIAKNLNVDLEKEFVENMQSLKTQLVQKLSADVPVK